MGSEGGSADRELHVGESGVIQHLAPVRGEAGGGDVDPGSLAVGWKLRRRRNTRLHLLFRVKSSTLRLPVDNPVDSL